MQKEIKTSVIIPVYNTEQYLEQCIQSVLNQTQKEIEIILVDDGSTDGSRSIIERYEKVYPNIKAIYQKNQKLGAARNAGLEMAKGKYVYFCDSDDYIATDLLEQCFRCSEEKNTDFVFFDAHSFCESNDFKDQVEIYDRREIGISDEVMSGVTFWNKFGRKGGGYSCVPFQYIRRDFLSDNSIKFMTGIFYEDNEWCVNMHLKSQRIYYIPHKFYYRRYRPNSIMTSNYSYMHLLSALAIYKEIISRNVCETERDKLNVVEDVLYAMDIKVREILQFLAENKKMEYQPQLKRFCEELRKLEALISSETLLVKVLMLHQFLQNSYEVDELNEARSQKITEIILRKYRLQENITVGIYGMGKMCDEIFDWYANHMYEIKADIVFLSTEPTVKTYRSYPVLTVEKAKKREFDHIIVASRKYSADMCENLKKYGIRSKDIAVTLGRLS